MAERSSSQSSIDSLSNHHPLSSDKTNIKHDSLQSSSSTLSSISTYERRHNRFLDKIGIRFRQMFRRFSHAPKSLTEPEIDILSKVTNFNREEIVKWYEKFLIDCPHGYMTKKEFIKTFKSLSSNGNAENFARHIFRAFDIDKSNTIDFREFLTGLSMTSMTSSPKTKLEWIFQVFDIDGNGLLTRDECLDVIDIIVRFSQAQVSNQNTLNIDELVMSAKNSMMRIFDNISTPRCDVLTKQQFVDGCEQDELISKLLAPGPAN